MIYLHLLMAVFATWRITELFTQDRITDRLRKRFPTYLWQCPRCMSVWAGVWCMAMFALGPFTHNLTCWSLWPFAFAWLFLVRVEQMVTKRMAERGRELTIRVKDGQTLYNSELTPQDSLNMMMMVAQQLQRQQMPQAQTPQTVDRPGPLTGLSNEEIARLNGEAK